MFFNRALRFHRFSLCYGNADDVFFEREAHYKDSAIADAKQITNLQTEITALRDEIKLLPERLKD